MANRRTLTDFCINASATVRAALESINLGYTTTLIVVDENKKLQGVLSEGDIRRAILSGVMLGDEILALVNECPLTLSEGFDHVVASKNMQALGATIAPITDKSGFVTGYFCPSNGSVRGTPVLIMAGGFGTRLGSITSKIPKPLVPIDGMPVIDRIIGQLSRQGFTKFFISVHHLASIIMKHCGDGSKYGVSINYIEEEVPLGTAGALTLVPESQFDESILLTNGDVLSNLDCAAFLQAHIDQRRDISIACRDYTYQLPYGHVMHDNGRVDKIVEKPKFSYSVNTGTYIINKKTLSHVTTSSRLDMDEFLGSAISAGHNIGAYLFHEYWIDMGSPQNLELANNDVKFGKLR